MRVTPELRSTSQDWTVKQSNFINDSVDTMKILTWEKDARSPSFTHYRCRQKDGNRNRQNKHHLQKEENQHGS